VRERDWRHAASGEVLTRVLYLIAASLGLTLTAEEWVPSTTGSTSATRTFDSDQPRSRLRRAARGAPLDVVQRSPGQRVATRLADFSSSPPSDASERPDCTLKEIIDNIEVRYTATCVLMDFAVRTTTDNKPLVPIELKVPGTIGLWTSHLGDYRDPVAEQSIQELREQLKLEVLEQLEPQQLQQRDTAHSIMESVLLTNGEQVEDGVRVQKITYGALWQLLTQMVISKTPYGVLTDAIIFVFLHIWWEGIDGERNLHVEHYVRHRYDQNPTVTACLAAIFKLAAEDATSPAPAANSWPSDIYKSLDEKLQKLRNHGAQGAGPAPQGCALIC
jgi:hypothetical protein